jgi:hypothetical protein
VSFLILWPVVKRSILLIYYLVSQQDPGRTVQIFIDLIQRHEQAFYGFVHKVHSKGEGLFDSLMRWIEQFLSLMRDGLGEPISLEFLLPHTGQERREIMEEVDAVARYHYLLKVAYEDKVRRRFGKSQGQSEADAEDEAAAEMVNGIVSDLSFGDLVKGDVDELAAEASDEEEEEESESESDEEDDSDEDDDDDDDSDDETESDSEGSDSSDSTEGRGKRRTTPTPSVVQRSRTMVGSRSPVSPSASSRQPYYQTMPKQSLDMPASSRPPPPPHLRGSRSMSLSEVGSPVTSKELPQLPHSARAHDRERDIVRGHNPPVTSKAEKRKAKATKAEGPTPPELRHLPQLLPLFVEMVRVHGWCDKFLELAR